MRTNTYRHDVIKSCYAYYLLSILHLPRFGQLEGPKSVRRPFVANIQPSGGAREQSLCYNQIIFMDAVNIIKCIFMDAVNSVQLNPSNLKR